MAEEETIYECHGITDEALLRRAEAIADAYQIAELTNVEIDGKPHDNVLALTDDTGGVVCFADKPADGGEERWLRDLLDMWDVMQSRPALLN